MWKVYGYVITPSTVIELICENELDDVDINAHEWQKIRDSENELDDVDINAHEWQKIRDSENSHWNGELGILLDYKFEVNECLQLLYDDTVEKMLIDEDMKNFK